MRVKRLAILAVIIAFLVIGLLTKQALVDQRPEQIMQNCLDTQRNLSPTVSKEELGRRCAPGL